jgi:hypothetical protein
MSEDTLSDLVFRPAPDDPPRQAAGDDPAAAAREQPARPREHQRPERVFPAARPEPRD